MANPAPPPPAPVGTWSYDPQPTRPDWGVRGPARKKLSTRLPIRVAPAPDQVVLCLTQGPETASPIVRVGDHVLTGQPVAETRLGGRLHASITGIVTAIESRPVPAAMPDFGPCLVVQRDGDEAVYAGDPGGPDPFNLPPEEICRRIAEAGIVGLGGALFPAAQKLSPGAPVQALIINGAECEPWITCDEMLLRERADSVVDGALIAMHALGTGHAVLGIESDMPEARVAAHDALVASGATGIGISVVTAKYPAGGERQLIELVTGREVPSGKLPSDIGLVVQNVATLAAISRLFRTGQPLISRVVTVTGGCVANPGNFEARIGTPMNQLLELAGGCRQEPARLLMGGPMMGFALQEDTLPVTKATNCIVAASPDEIPPAGPEMPCIRCGECAQVCPARLQPQDLHAATRAGDRDMLRLLGLADCIDCGCCDYVCPSYIPLTARFIRAKRHMENAP